MCRFVYQFTNPVVMPLRNAIPRWRRVDFASLLVAWLLAILELVCLFAIVMGVLTVAQGHSGAPWTTLCAIFGGVYLISLAIFRR